MDKRVVIITYSMIPHAIAWGGCQRMYYLAEEFIKKGYSLSMFSVKNNINRDFGNRISFTHYPLPINNSLFQAFINSKLQSDPNYKGNCGNNKKFENVISNLRNYIKKSETAFRIINNLDQYVFNEPSFLMGIISRYWCICNNKTISDYIQDNDVKCVIISGPPFGMFCIAKYIKKRNPRVSIISDYRDPWNLWKRKSSFALYLERTNFKYVDRVIFTNTNLAKDMAIRFSIPESKINIVANGYSEKAWNQLKYSTKFNKRKEQMIITYTGSIDIVKTSNLGFRDVTQLFEAFQDILKSGCDIKLVFVGVVNPNTDYIKELMGVFNNYVEFIPTVSNEEALSYMSNSDVLLILHTTNDTSSRYLVGGKLYDYIKAEKYILSIGDTEGLNSQIIKDNGIGTAVINNKQEITETVKNIYKLWKANELYVNKKIKIEEYSREYQNSRYIEIVKELL